MLTPRIARRALALPAALAAIGGAATVVAPAAQAEAGSCAATDVSQPFAAWGDQNLYRLAPGGSFDGATGWSLSGGAAIAAGDDAFNLAGADTSASLTLPPGATAQSPFSCVDSTQPTFRFVTQQATGGATLKVDVVYRTVSGATASAPVGVLTPSRAWAPSPPLQTGAQLAGLPSGGTAQMALRFTALTSGSQVDDVFIDPRMHGP